MYKCMSNVSELKIEENRILALSDKHATHGTRQHLKPKAALFGVVIQYRLALIILSGYILYTFWPDIKTNDYSV